MEGRGADYTDLESMIEYFVTRIDNTYFPSLPPTSYPMSEGQTTRMADLMRENSEKILAKATEIAAQPLEEEE